MTELPTLAQPPGYVVLYRGERPPNCLSFDRASQMMYGGSRGRWFTTNFGYAACHLTPTTAAGFLRGLLGIPHEQGPLKHPERFGADAVWRIKAITIPEDVAQAFFCRNEFVHMPGDRGVIRRVEYPMQKEHARAYRRLLRGKPPRRLRSGPDAGAAPFMDGGGIVYLLPRHVVDQAATVYEGGHRETWAWADGYVSRGMKPVPDGRVNVSLAELEVPGTQDLERLDGVREDIPEAWILRAVLQYPAVQPYAGWLSGEDQDDVMQLAAEVSAQLARR